MSPTQERATRRTTTKVQRTDALGGVEFMPGKRQHVDMSEIPVHADRQFR